MKAILQIYALPLIVCYSCHKCPRLHHKSYSQLLLLANNHMYKTNMWCKIFYKVAFAWITPKCFLFFFCFQFQNKFFCLSSQWAPQIKLDDSSRWRGDALGVWIPLMEERLGRIVIAPTATSSSWWIGLLLDPQLSDPIHRKWPTWLALLVALRTPL